MINIYVANLGKYTEGELKGEWIKLPATKEEIQDLYNRIGINSRYEEVAIHDYECDFMEIGEYTNIDELNKLAYKLDNMDEWERTVVQALMRVICHDIDDAISIVEDGSYSAIQLDTNMMNDAENLGYSYIEEVFGKAEYLDRDTLEEYFDLESFGRDLSFDGVDYELEIEYCGYTDLANQYIDMLGGIEMLGNETLERYFDYESFGDTLLFDYSIDDETMLAICAY